MISHTMNDCVEMVILNDSDLVQITGGTSWGEVLLDAIVTIVTDLVVDAAKEGASAYYYYSSALTPEEADAMLYSLS